MQSPFPQQYDSNTIALHLHRDLMGSITYFPDFRGVIKGESTAWILSDASGFPLHIFFVFSLTMSVYTHSLTPIP